MQYTFDIEGMTCGGCVRAVENALKRVDGVEAIAVDLATGRASVTTTVATPAALLAAIEDAGYDARVRG